MTHLLDQAFEVARALPERTQDEIARLILETARGKEAVIALSDEEDASFDASIAEEERGEFVNDDDLRAFWAKIGA